MKSTLVVDTSVLFAALNKTDASHLACASLLSSGIAVVLPAPVVVEAALLSRRRAQPHGSIAVLDSVLDESVIVADLDREDYARVRHLVERYADLPLDVVDASVVAIAERLEQDTIATLDHRHFSVVRPRHAATFTLVP